MAVVRRAVGQVERVVRTWIEWESDDRGALTKTRVVQVRFDTDPNSYKYRLDTMAAIPESRVHSRARLRDHDS